MKISVAAHFRVLAMPPALLCEIGHAVSGTAYSPPLSFAVLRRRLLCSAVEAINFLKFL